MDAVQIVAEPRRREILRLVWDAERSAGEIADAFDITFGAVSQHLGVLRRAGLVLVRQDGTRRFYRANKEALGLMAGWLESMWADQLDRLAALAEEASSTVAAPGEAGRQPAQKQPSLANGGARSRNRPATRRRALTATQPAPQEDHPGRTRT